MKFVGVFTFKLLESLPKHEAGRGGVHGSPCGTDTKKSDLTKRSVTYGEDH